MSTAYLRGLCALALLSVAACADESGTTDTETLSSIEADHGDIDGGVRATAAGEEDETDSAVAAGDGGRVRDPQGAYIGSIIAIGTGCPAGTWDAQLDEDGKDLSVTFSAFEAAVDPTRSVSNKNCSLRLELHTPAGVAFTVDEAFWEVDLKLEQDVQALVELTYYFQGQVGGGQTVRSEFVGPLEQKVLFQNVSSDVSSSQSRCGTKEMLVISPHLRVLNSSPRRSGSARIERFPPSSKLGLKLSWKRC